MINGFKVGSIGNVVFKGTTIHFLMHAGYAVDDWAFGVAAGFNSLSINSISANGVSYDKGTLSSIDNELIGGYLTKYFMPLNVFVCLEGGVGKFSIMDNAQNSIGETDKGFAWNIRAGKEFFIGKKKKLGLGAYIILSGLKSHDKAPAENDTYSYLGPGAGLALSFHW